MQTTFTVLRGLLITVEYTIDPADRSVGIFHESVEWHIVGVAGKPAKNTKWLFKRIENAGEIDRVDEACFNDWDARKSLAYDPD